MLHGPYPVVDLLGQISGSNAGSKLSVKIVGQIHGSNPSVKLLVEFTDQIHWSNCWVKLLVKIMGQIPGSNWSVKFLGQICRSNTLVKRSQSLARRWRARSMHGCTYGQPENGLGWAGNRQRKKPRFAGVACDGLACD